MYSWQRNRTLPCNKILNRISLFLIRYHLRNINVNCKRVTFVWVIGNGHRFCFLVECILPLIRIVDNSEELFYSIYIPEFLRCRGLPVGNVLG